jgi:hypothetical protein
MHVRCKRCKTVATALSSAAIRVWCSLLCKIRTGLILLVIKTVILLDFCKKTSLLLQLNVRPQHLRMQICQVIGLKSPPQKPKYLVLKKYAA